MGAGRFGAHGGGKKPAHHTRLREQREAGCRHAGHQTGRPARGRAERTHRRGATDGSFLRQKGIDVYGAPLFLREDKESRAHGNDERISLVSLSSGVQLLKEIVLAVQ